MKIRKPKHRSATQPVEPQRKVTYRGRHRQGPQEPLDLFHSYMSHVDRPNPLREV